MKTRNMKLITLISFLLVFSLIPTSYAAQTIGSSRKAQIIKYLEAKFNLPSDATVRIGKIKPSQIAGLTSFELIVTRGSGEERKMTFFASSDGRFVLAGKIDVFDVTKDPIQEVLDKISLKNLPFKGSSRAKVTIVEYSDFQCPYCSRLYNTMENEVLTKYGKDVKVVFKHFPLAFHDWAMTAAVASECAALQRKKSFWAFHDYFFENQKALNKDNVLTKVYALAGKEGLKVGKFKRCVKNQETLAKVKADMAEGQSVGVTGTPLTVVNGHILNGAVPFSEFQKVIDKELSK